MGLVDGAFEKHRTKVMRLCESGTFGFLTYWVFKSVYVSVAVTAQATQAIKQYSSYLNFTVRLLDILKTRMGRYYEAALDTSAAAGFKELTESPVLWKNLKPEQKALAQLLLGQIDSIQGKI
ncbi:hypothetical protein C8R11_11123 [Nitrosomonas aestuarii]|nr:hypothetical protein C8R11_11123 [Nitrosomonas aestuarii]